MKNAPRILIIGAHHEEIEAECPNTAAALALAGCEVVILNPVGGWNWSFIRDLPGNGKERTIDDAVKAAAELGCRKVIWDYPVAKADRFQAEIMDRMARFLLEYSPDAALIHWPQDTHADHRLIAKISLHVLNTAVDLSEERFPDYRPVREVYAFQTGVSQAFNFMPDVLVKCDETTMQMAEKAVRCFENTAPQFVPQWRENFRSKAAYWGNMTGVPAEGLKFLGPLLPLDGFLLKKILKERLIPAAVWENGACCEAFYL